MISALPVSGACVPKIVGPHDVRPKISFINASFICPSPSPPSSGPRWQAHSRCLRTSSLSGAMIRANVGSMGRSYTLSPQSASIGSTSSWTNVSIQSSFFWNSGSVSKSHMWRLPLSVWSRRPDPCQNASWMNQNASSAEELIDAGDAIVARATQRALARRQAVYADEVRRLLDAGLEVMRQFGTTQSPRVSDIVDVAGLSRAAFYRPFASK